jgi:hypothetical protein
MTVVSPQSSVVSPRSSVVSQELPVVVIGGGISGLVSAALIGKAGLPVVLLERTSAVGGRAATREKNGFCFNLGPHALYRRGVLRQTLKRLGIDVRGGIPTGNGGFAISGRRTHTLPVGLASLLMTGVLPIAAKIEFDVHSPIERQSPRFTFAVALNSAGKISEIYVVSATRKLTAIK